MRENIYKYTSSLYQSVDVYDGDDSDGGDDDDDDEYDDDEEDDGGGGDDEDDDDDNDFCVNPPMYSKCSQL